MSLLLFIVCEDCGMSYPAGKKCRCHPPAWNVPPPRPSGRRPKGSVKDVVLRAKEKGMTVPETASLTGLNPYTLYNAASRLGIKLRRIYR